MMRNSRQQMHWLVFAIAFLLLTVFVFGPLARSLAQQMAGQSPAMKLAGLKLKFDGSRSCGGTDCHDKAGDTSPPTEAGHELTIWTSQDLHKKSFEILADAKSKAIGTKMKIADVTADNKCVSCHGLNVADNLRGQRFNLREGNTCTQCHGPSEKWLAPHSEKGWTDKQRAAAGSHEKLLTTLGLYDTKPLVARAEICVSCHLDIDAEMVAAGHPQPMFDLDEFTRQQPPHWRDPGGYFETKTWLAGQVVAVRESMQQLATRAKASKDSDGTKAAYQQAMAHLTVFKAAATVLGLDVASWDVKPDSMAADAAKVATNADDLKIKIAAWEPKESPLPMLKKIVEQKNMAKDYGLFGVKQMGYAISALYRSAATGGKFKDADRDAVIKVIDDKFFPEKGEPKVETFDKDLADVVAKLPA